MRSHQTTPTLTIHYLVAITITLFFIPLMKTPEEVSKRWDTRFLIGASLSEPHINGLACAQLYYHHHHHHIYIYRGYVRRASIIAFVMLTIIST